MDVERSWVEDSYCRSAESTCAEKTNEIFDIADDEEIPVASRRLRTDVRLKMAEKLIPDTYGKKIDHQLSVSDDFMQMLSAAKNVGHVLPDSDGAVLIEGEVID